MPKKILTKKMLGRLCECNTFREFEGIEFDPDLQLHEDMPVFQVG